MTSSLYATERHPAITHRTDLCFYRCTYEKEEYLAVMSTCQRWLALAQQRKKTASDPRIKKIFAHMIERLPYLASFIEREGTSNAQGRQVYLACRGKIEAIAYGREFCGGDSAKLFAIYANPENLPDTSQALNQATSEGPDSFLLRKLVEHALNDTVLLPCPENQKQGYKNIIDPLQGVTFDDFWLCCNQKELLQRIQNRIPKLLITK